MLRFAVAQLIQVLRERGAHDGRTICLGVHKLDVYERIRDELGADDTAPVCIDDDGQALPRFEVELDRFFVRAQSARPATAEEIAAHEAHQNQKQDTEAGASP